MENKKPKRPNGRRTINRREICDPQVHVDSVVLARGGGLRIVQPGLRPRYRQGV